jgi:hypothetical protein
MAALAGADCDQQARAAREQAVGERLHQPPGVEARRELGLAPQTPPPARWSVRTIRAWVAALADYRLSGVWRLLQRLAVRRRALRDHLYSPDLDDVAKVAHLERCLREAVRHPEEVVVLFLDEMGSYRWPARACDWMLAGPGVAAALVHKAGPTNRQQRLIGALNALTAQVDCLDNYLLGRHQVSAFSRRLDQVYPAARRIYVVQDTWSIHHHDDVLCWQRCASCRACSRSGCRPTRRGSIRSSSCGTGCAATCSRVTASPTTGRSCVTRSTPSSISSPMARLPCSALSAWSGTDT